MNAHRQLSRRAILCGAIATLILASGPISAQEPAPTANRKVFTNSVVALPAQPSIAIGAPSLTDHKEDKMEILFSLEIPKEAQAALEKKVAEGKIVTPEELQRDYSAPAAGFDSLVKWLKEQNFEVTQTSTDRTSVYVRGTVGDIEKNLLVKMVRVTKDGITYNAAKNAPSLPAEVGAGVQAIIGLQPFRQMHKRHVKVMPLDGNRMDAPGAPTAPGAPGFATNTANKPPYLVPEILKAYRANGLDVTGAGQTIAILIDAVPKDSDLQQFRTSNHLPTTQTVEIVKVNSGHLPTPEGEETLDVEWSGGTAPGATIRVYATGSLSFVDLDKALDRMISDLATQPQLHQLSISLGLGESFMPGGQTGEAATEHNKFLKLVAGGVNIFVSTGDAGSNPDDTGHGTGSIQQVEYQSSDPFVVGVGGTSLKLNQTTGQVVSETAWISSGGGKSQFFDRPVWQKGAGIDPSGTERLVPDVSLAADPNTGAFVFFQGQPQQIGGTSWSAPVWAGFCALINEARAKKGKGPLPFLNPLLYPLAGQSSNVFRDITVGNNVGFNAGAGHDLVTGLGVPNVQELINELVK